MIREITGQCPDILVNNAGAAQAKAATDLTEEDWGGIIYLNLSGVFRVAQAAAREIIEDGRLGAIVNIVSILGLRVTRGVASYAASKAAVIQLSKALAIEWAQFNIRGLLCNGGLLRADPAEFIRIRERFVANR